jgi:hypothetical protein
MLKSLYCAIAAALAAIASVQSLAHMECYSTIGVGLIFAFIAIANKE